MWCGVVWCGVVWCGVVWCGVVWCGVVWCVWCVCGVVCVVCGGVWWWCVCGVCCVWCVWWCCGGVVVVLWWCCGGGGVGVVVVSGVWRISPTVSCFIFTTASSDMILPLLDHRSSSPETNSMAGRTCVPPASSSPRSLAAEPQHSGSAPRGAAPHHTAIQLSPNCPRDPHHRGVENQRAISSHAGSPHSTPPLHSTAPQTPTVKLQASCSPLRPMTCCGTSKTRSSAMHRNSVAAFPIQPVPVARRGSAYDASQAARRCHSASSIVRLLDILTRLERQLVQRHLRVRLRETTARRS